MFTPAELLAHLTLTVIPLRHNLEVPVKVHINIPTRPEMATLGTQANDVIALDNDTHDAETKIRLNVIKVRNRLEDGGYGDRLQDYQGSMPIFKNEQLKKSVSH